MILINRITVTSQCVRSKSKKANCDVCVETCVQRALSTTESGGIHFHVSACNQCGACVAACPVNAIEGNLPVRKTEQHTIFEDQTSHPSVKELLLYHQKGYQHLIITSEESHWHTVIQQTNKVLARLSQPLLTFTCDPSVITEHISKSRRAFLRVNLLNRNHASSAPKIDNQLLPQLFSDYQFFTVNLDSDSCSLCSACLRLCPTSALKYEQQHFVIENGRCVGCKICQDGCPEQSLEVQESIQHKTHSRTPFVFNVCHECKQHYLALSGNNMLCAPCKVKKSLNLGESNLMSKSLNI